MTNYKIQEDILIREYLKGYFLSNSTIYKLFLENKILVNGFKVKDNYMLHKGDLLSIKAEEMTTIPYDKPLEIIYEDDYLLVVNKPYGFVIYDENNEAVDNMVASLYLKRNFNHKVRHIHRLDRETTGILLYAKDILTEAYFNYHLANHDFKRYYLALVSGQVKEHLVIEKPIGKDRHTNNKYLVLKNGKYAKTEVFPLKYKNNISLIKVLLYTGRTHQIRVHLKNIKHPLLNDPIYNPGYGKMALMSYQFIFIHPFTKEEIIINCPLNEEFKGYE